MVSILLIFIIAGLGKWILQNKTPPVTSKNINKLVSSAPSVTEIIFELGLGNRLVGVSTFCDTPKEALLKAKIGGINDLDLEAIIHLDPDLVILTSSKGHEKSVLALKERGVQVMVVNHNSIMGILDSIKEFGKLGGPDSEQKAKELLENIDKRLAQIRSQAEKNPQPHVLGIYGAFNTIDPARGVTAIGRGNLYDDMISIAGGKNILPEDAPQVPRLSLEHIFTLDPEVILIVASTNQNSSSVLESWHQYDQLQAVKNNRVKIIAGDYVFRPSHRFILTLESIAQAIH